MRKLTIADLELLFTANTDKVEKAEKQVLAIGKKIESNPIKVGADAKDALGSMDRVEKAAKKLVSERAVIKLDADVSRAEKNLARAVDKLEDLHIRAEGGLDVTADVKRAEASIQRIERMLDGLKKARNAVDIEVNEEPAETGLKRFLSLFKRRTEEAGDEGGRSLGQGLDAATRGAGQKVGDVVGGDIEKTLVDALSAIPIAGGIILGGVAIGKAITGAIEDGLAVEKNTDRLQGLTGISEADALRLGRASGEAYANNFGESIESNMDATRLALQFRILDPSATTRDAQLVVQGLTGIADVLGEDIRPTAQAVTQLLSTGLARNAQEAYDLIAAGARNGLNRNEDLLDTLTEYPSLFQRLGLSGEEALGLVSQGMKAGARNSDLAADALKEFQIRATDASELSASGFEALGLNAEEMTNKIVKGGASARDGLAEVLTKLREMEPGVERNNAAVALFGTMAEDLGDSLFAMDLSTAVDQLDGVTGSAQRMFDTLAGNDASKIEQAQKNIEVAAEGIKGALAAAFSEPLGDLADFVSQNRGPVLEFFRDMAVGALDFAITASDATGDFVSGPLAEMIAGFVSFLKLSNFDPFKDWTEIDALVEDLRGFDSVTDDASDTLRGWKGELSDFADPLIALGYVNDAALRTADAVAQVGYKADGTAASTFEMKNQTEAAVIALQAELETAAAAGESQQNLTDRYNATTEALVAQLIQMGYTDEEARALIETYGAVPEIVDTTLQAHTEDAQNKVNSFIETNQQRNLRIKVIADGSAFVIPTSTGGRTVSAQASGSVLEFMAQGGLTPMQPLAQVVPPNTWRVVGDRSDVPELFAPLDGSARSWALLMEGFRRMPGVMPMADGGMLTPTRGAAPGEVRFGDIIIRGEGLSVAEVLSLIREEVRRVLGSALGG